MVPIARIPSFKPTASGTLLVPLVDPTVGASVGIVVKVVDCSADASSWRRTLYDQMKQAIRRGGESGILHYCFTSLVTNRKKSRANHAPLAPSCVRVTVCLPVARLVFDHNIDWFTPNLVVAFTCCGVEPHMLRC